MRFCLLIVICFLASCADEPKPKPSVPAYQTLHHLTAHGAMFHFNDQGSFYIGCSIHQGGMTPGTQLKRAGQENAVVIKSRVHAQKDLHVWTYDQSTLSPKDALPYLRNAEIKTGDRIFILNKKNRISCVVTTTPQRGGDHYTYRTEKPFPAGGMSGSPIFSARTGTVVGVLQTANSKTEATRGGFEALKMP